MENTVIHVPGPGEDLVVVKSKMPELPEYGAIIKVHCAGICHSDVHMSGGAFKMTEDVSVSMEQLNPEFKWPYIPGHEIAGEVYSLDSKSRPDDPDLKVGDRVLVYPWVGCGQCERCTNGISQLCDQSVIYNIGVGVPGGYQSYMTVLKKSNLVKMPDSLPADVGCTLPCSGITAYHACKQLKGSIQTAIKCSGKAKLLIIGAGGLGLWATSIARVLYPVGLQIYMADVAEDKLEQAKKSGVDETILWPRSADEETIIASTKEITGGIDTAVDFVGTAATFNRAYQCAEKGASIAMVGLAGGLAQVPLVAMILNNINIAGICVGNIELTKEFVALYGAGQITAPPLHHVSPEGAAEALKNLKLGKVQGRSIIKFV